MVWKHSTSGQKKLRQHFGPITRAETGTVAYWKQDDIWFYLRPSSSKASFSSLKLTTSLKIKCCKECFFDFICYFSRHQKWYWECKGRHKLFGKASGWIENDLYEICKPCSKIWRTSKKNPANFQSKMKKILSIPRLQNSEPNDFISKKSVLRWIRAEAKPYIDVI